MTLQRKKEIGILVVAMLITVLYLMSFLAIIQQQPIWSTLTWVLILGLSLVWASLFIACTVFVTNRSGSNTLLAAIPPVLLVLVGKFSIPVIVGGLMMLFVLLVMQRRLGWELGSRVKIQFLPIFWGSTRDTLFALLIACFALAIPSIQKNFDERALFIPSSVMAQILKPADFILEGLIPGYTSDSTVDQVINAQIAQQAGQLPQGFSVPASQRTILRDQFGKQFGLTLTGQETMAGIIAQTVNKQIQILSKDNPWAVLLIAGSLLFFAMRIIIPILAAPVLLLLQLWIFIAVRIGLIIMVKTQIEVDRISL